MIWENLIVPMKFRYSGHISSSRVDQVPQLSQHAIHDDSDRVDIKKAGSLTRHIRRNHIKANSFDTLFAIGIMRWNNCFVFCIHAHFQH